MRTVAIEEHFLIPEAREFAIAQPARLFDVGTTRLQNMDANGIDLQVLSHAVLDSGHFTSDEMVSFSQSANDQLAATEANRYFRSSGPCIQRCRASARHL